jgi:hypothetical protein
MLIIFYIFFCSFSNKHSKQILCIVCLYRSQLHRTHVCILEFKNKRNLGNVKKSRNIKTTKRPKKMIHWNIHTHSTHFVDIYLSVFGERSKIFTFYSVSGCGCGSVGEWVWLWVFVCEDKRRHSHHPPSR